MTNLHETTGKHGNCRTWLVPVLVTAFCVILLIWINVYSRSVRFSREGDAFLAEGKLIEAVTSYEISAHAYTPWNPHVRHSMEKLWEIGERLERENEDPTYPLIAYRALRSSVYAIRSFYMPYKDWIPRCDEKIGQLVMVQKEMIDSASPSTDDPLSRQSDSNSLSVPKSEPASGSGPDTGTEPAAVIELTPAA